jgi:hypothetical protein
MNEPSRIEAMQVADMAVDRSTMNLYSMCSSKGMGWQDDNHSRHVLVESRLRDAGKWGCGPRSSK